MKKLIFLLILAVAFASIVFAQDTAHPPGAYTLKLAEYGAQQGVVTQPTVLEAEVLSVELPASFSAISETTVIIYSGKPQIIGTMNKSAADYYLRC